MNCGNQVAEKGWGEKKWLPKSGKELKINKNAMSTIFTFLQQIKGKLLLVQI